MGKQPELPRYPRTTSKTHSVSHTFNVEVRDVQVGPGGGVATT